MRRILYTKESFIENANELHNNKYDYSLMSYKGINGEIEIICPTHGTFKLIARNHLLGTGCPKCKDNSARVKAEKLNFSKKEYEEKYTKEVCRELCSRCKNRHDFSKEYSMCYGFLKRMHEDWLEEFLPIKKHKLSYENCYNRAKKFQTIKDFCKQDHSAYQKALREGWITDFTWLSYSQLPSGYWTYETCYEEAKKYTTLSDYVKNAIGAYVKSVKNGWNKDYTWLKRAEISTKNEYVIYMYENTEKKSVYVGLTKDLKRRHKQHHDGEKKHGVMVYDNVHKYFESIGEEVPEPIILQSDIYANEAQEYEQFYIEYFKDEGLNVINKAKGGSLGGGGKLWTKETCHKEALKYKTKVEFRKNALGAFVAAKKNGWIDDYTWLETTQKPSGYWIYERCYNEALKYQTLRDFIKNGGGAYGAAKRNGWLEDFKWLKRSDKTHKNYWTYERCKEEASKYNNKSEFRIKSINAYQATRKNGWLYDFFQNEKKCSYETCVIEAAKYKTKTEFRKNNSTAYQYSVRNNFINELFPKKKWTYNECLKEASYYKTKTDFRKKCPKAYNVARKNKWIKKIFEKNKEIQLVIDFK